jgi:hypothetical protein
MATSTISEFRAALSSVARETGASFDVVFRIMTSMGAIAGRRTTCPRPTD